MAKRKRLTPPDPANLTPAAMERAPASALVNPPIADVARDAAQQAAMTEVVEELANARQEGRLVQVLPIAAIDLGYLVRDRIQSDDADMETLKVSIAARGQQTPIDVITIAPGRYGLISGWRRLAAIQALKAETGDAQYDQIKALNRTPETSSEAYVAMVEENEIRVGLSYYERARIAMKAAEQGAYKDPRAAIRDLFRSASRAKRSKIGSFLTLVEALDPVLRFPAAIPERLGLRLAKELEGDEIAAELFMLDLEHHKPDTPDAEISVLEGRLARREGVPGSARTPAPGSTAGSAAGSVAGRAARSDAVQFPSVEGLEVRRTGTKIVITGPHVSDDLAQMLADWLKTVHK